MASKHEIQLFDHKLDEETQKLKSLSAKVSSLSKGPATDKLNSAVKSLEDQKVKVRWLAEQSKVFAGWAPKSPLNEYIPPEKPAKYKFILPLLALIAAAYTMYR